MNQIEQVLQQRGKRYGDFTDHAAVAQALQDVMRRAGTNVCGEYWDKLSNVQKQALSVIADKIARILSGDPNYDDNWIDIQGYAKLAQDRLVGTKGCDVQLEKSPTLSDRYSLTKAEAAARGIAHEWQVVYGKELHDVKVLSERTGACES